MRILIVGSHHRQMSDSFYRSVNHLKITKWKKDRGMIEMEDGTEIVLLAVRSPDDIHRIRGQRFDLVLEDEDFLGPRIAMDEIKAQVLR